MIDKVKAATYILILIFCLAFWFFVFCITGHAMTSTQRNSLGVLQYEENPLTYAVGDVVDGTVIEGSKALNIRLQPLGTYSLFTEQLLFCGVPGNLFEGKANPVVLTFETKSHRSVSGIGCHRLIRVDEMK